MYRSGQIGWLSSDHPVVSSQYGGRGETTFTLARDRLRTGWRECDPIVNKDCRSDARRQAARWIVRLPICIPEV
ncbi:protein of unknown function [Paraburkholderia kururiensis]